MKIIKQYIAYIKDNPEKLWFKRKLYGWGWTPATWQGWAVIGIFIATILKISFQLPEEPSNGEAIWFFAKIITLVALIIFICYKKGEKPRWQWGNKK